ncbi:MAG: hypothetical protein EOP85_16995, partial [Verrucomicrobiaceae bacterium]
MDSYLISSSGDGQKRREGAAGVLENERTRRGSGEDLVTAATVLVCGAGLLTTGICFGFVSASSFFACFTSGVLSNVVTGFSSC